MNKKRLFVDDCRFPPDASWLVAKTAEEALRIMRAEDLDTVSLDFDLNLREGPPGTWNTVEARNGLWLVERMILEGLLPPKIPHIFVHSTNPQGAPAMRARLVEAQVPR